MEHRVKHTREITKDFGLELIKYSTHPGRFTGYYYVIKLFDGYSECNFTSNTNTDRINLTSLELV